MEENALIFEFCEAGDLYDYVKAERFSEKLTKTYFSKLLETINYLHTEKNIAHRDIKLENIFLDQNYNLKLGDFGFAEEMNKNISEYSITGT